MEELIATYLFQNKTCPLPGVGSLSIGDRTASFVLGEKQLHPPLPYVSFSPAERSADDLVRYLSFQRSVSKEEALQSLEQFCARLNNMDSYAEIEIPQTGKFYVDVEGSLVFKPIHFPDALLPSVPAERIIHPDDTHTIIVGDKESNSAIMTEFYSEGEAVRKSNWWIWALVLAVLAGIAIAIHYSNNNGVGNGIKPPEVTERKTYREEK